jgi:hypothetical protein
MEFKNDKLVTPFKRKMPFYEVAAPSRLAPAAL